MPNKVFCKKMNQELDGLEKPPFPGHLGEKIYKNISQEAWNMWFSLQTKIVNEYQLDMHEPEARNFVLKNMENFFFSSTQKDDDKKLD